MATEMKARMAGVIENDLQKADKLVDLVEEPGGQHGSRTPGGAAQSGEIFEAGGNAKHLGREISEAGEEGKGDADEGDRGDERGDAGDADAFEAGSTATHDNWR